MAPDQFSALLELLVFTWLDGFALLSLLCFFSGFLGWYAAAFARFCIVRPLARLLSRWVRRCLPVRRPG